MAYKSVTYWFYKQLAIVAFIAVICMSTKGLVAAYSVLLGAGIILLANRWFIWRLKGLTRQHQASEVVLTCYYRAEAGRVAIVLFLLGGVFVFANKQIQGLCFELDLPMLMLGFVIVAVSSAISASTLLSRIFSQQ